MKNWILDTFFAKEFQAKIDQYSKDWIREASIDAFKKAHADILETHQEDVEQRAEELSREKLAQLLSVVDPNLILTIDTKTKSILVGGERIDQGRVANLRSEALFFAESELWKIIVESNKKLAERAMFVDDGKLENQLLKGRAILYTLDTQQKVIDLLSSLSTGPNSS